MRCKVCKRNAKLDELCRYHSAARNSLNDGYDVWRKAYADISWKDYLHRVKDLGETGRWVKEVIVLEESQVRID